MFFHKNFVCVAVSFCLDGYMVCFGGQSHLIYLVSLLSLVWLICVPRLRDRRQDMQWLRTLPYTVSLSPVQFEGALVVHAGLVPGVDLERQSRQDMTCMRNLVPAAGGAGHRAIEGAGEGEGWAGVWRGPHKVYFGHDAKRGLQLQWPLAVGLDTGCCYGKCFACSRTQ
jgi:hypothetical protein